MESDYLTLGIPEGLAKMWLRGVGAEIVVRCRDCEYGEQDEVGRWFCRSFGCQVGNEDGSGFCADGERRKEKG